MTVALHSGQRTTQEEREDAAHAETLAYFSSPSRGWSRIRRSYRDAPVELTKSQIVEELVAFIEYGWPDHEIASRLGIGLGRVRSMRAHVNQNSRRYR